MATADSSFRRAASGYIEKTHRPLNCLVFILPLLTAYEAGALFFRGQLLAPQHLAKLLKLLGAAVPLLPAMLIVLILLLWHVLTRQKWHVDGDALGGMLVESVLWMLPLLAASAVLARAHTAAADPAAGLGAEILMGIGAGIYEEFIFRLAGIGLFLLVTVDVIRAPKKPMAVVAVILTAILFSLYHFVGVEQFNAMGFVFRAVAGAYLAGVYIMRGFGIAVGAHACYNIVLALT